MTPQTLNYIDMKRRMEQGSQGDLSGVIEAFKRRGLLPALQEALRETQYSR